MIVATITKKPSVAPGELQPGEPVAGERAQHQVRDDRDDATIDRVERPAQDVGVAEQLHGSPSSVSCGGDERRREPVDAPTPASGDARNICTNGIRKISATGTSTRCTSRCAGAASASAPPAWPTAARAPGGSRRAPSSERLRPAAAGVDDDADRDQQGDGEQPVGDRRAVAELEVLERLVPQVVDDRLAWPPAARRAWSCRRGRRAGSRWIVCQIVDEHRDRRELRADDVPEGLPPVAPSIRAASSSSRGMSCSAAR